mgnify:CR=1 FL=1
MALNLERLSKEELIALLRKAEAELAQEKARREKLELNYAVSAEFIIEMAPLIRCMRQGVEAALTDDPEENKKLWTDLRKAIQDLANEARKSDVYQYLAFGAGNERITPNADAFSAVRNEISADMNAVENGIRCADARAESACGAHPGRPERRRGTFSGRSRRQGRHGPHCQCAQACA